MRLIILTDAGPHERRRATGRVQSTPSTVMHSQELSGQAGLRKLRTAARRRREGSIAISVVVGVCL